MVLHSSSENNPGGLSEVQLLLAGDISKCTGPHVDEDERIKAMGAILAVITDLLDGSSRLTKGDLCKAAETAGFTIDFLE